MNVITPTTSVHVGTPSPSFVDWSSTKAYYHGFAGLSTERDVGVDSPDFIALGNPWFLRLFPGGFDNSRSGNSSRRGWVAIYLHNRSNKNVKVHFGFSIKHGKDYVANMQTPTHVTFDPVGIQCSSRGWCDFAERSTLIDSLVDGTLVVEVHMKPHEPIKAALTQFIPENPFCNNMLQIFNDEESSDIVFAVGDHQPKNNAEKVAKIEPVKFHAHRVIITACSAILADLCKTKGDPTTPIEIMDVSPDIFRHLLHYIYGGKIPDDDMMSHAKDIINAANRYGVATLKLEAEASLVQGTTFSLENVMEHLIYAESMNCALLKETAMDYIVENKDKVIGKISFNDAPGNLMSDLLVAVSREQNRADAIGENEFNVMRISELRRKAHEKGLNVDGSREMLIAALKEKENVVV
jgi:hypothetical protein